MNASRIAARASIAAAVLLALLVSRRRPWHRPIAAALGIPLALDVLRASVPLPYEAAMIAYMAWPFLAAWAALRVLVGWSAAPAWAALLPSVACAAACAAVVSLDAVADGSIAWALAVQLAAAAAWWRSHARRNVTALCALVLAAGDALATLGPVWHGGDHDLARWQAAAVAFGLCALQMHALRRRGAME